MTNNNKRARSAGPKKDENGTWSFIVDIGADENGRRRQAKRRGFATKREAQAALDALRVSVTSASYVAPARQSVGEFLDEWLSTIEATVRPATLSSYKRLVRVHVRPEIGGVQLQKLDAGNLNKLYAAVAAKGLSPRTVKYVHNVVHRALRDAVRWGRVIRNVASQADPPRDTRSPEMQAWTAGEVATFLEAVQGNRWRVGWLLLAMTGARRGEVLALRWSDVSLDAGRVTITRALIVVDHRTQFGPTKTGKSRTIDLDPFTVAELRAHKAKQAQEMLSLGLRPDADALVFAKVDGEPANPDKFSREFGRAIARTGSRRIPLHGLRHSHATILLEAGVPVNVVSQRLGHSKPSITMNVYQHLTPTMQSDAAAKIGARVFGAAQ